jgi:hypothetical protein
MHIYARAMRRLAVAIVVVTAVVVASAPPGAAAAADPPTGSVAGTLVNGGTPVADASVHLIVVSDGRRMLFTETDDEGRFRFDGVQPDTYTLWFGMPGGGFVSQYHPGVADLAAATPFTVAAGEEVSVDETVMAHGTLGGRVTTDDGAPAAGGRVHLYPWGGGRQAWTSVRTDANGNYRFEYPPLGQFSLAFSIADYGSPLQWFPRSLDPYEGERVVIRAGEHTTVDERLLPVGAVRGRFTRNGEPVANVTVSLGPPGPDGFIYTPYTSTAADGTFRLWLFPGEYRIWFRPPSARDQWFRGAERYEAATPVTVTADAEVVIEERQLPVGRAQGRLVDAAGRPVESGTVQISDPSRGRYFDTWLGSNGEWSALVWPGEYRVRFSTSNQVQWAVGATTPEDADPVVVTADGTTVVNDRLLAPGSLAVTAVDAVTRAPIRSFCVWAQGPVGVKDGCTEDGSVRLTQLGPGSYKVSVTADDYHLDWEDNDVRVAPGRTTRLVARLSPAGTVSVTTTDAASGERIGSGCAWVVPVDRPTEPNESNLECDYEGASQFTVGKVRPGRYAVFADTNDGPYGAQWVGPRGGVGALAAARMLTVSARAATAVAVRYDGAGDVAGTVTARSGGRPVEQAEVGVGAVGAGYAFRSAITGADGRYVLRELGPYRWTLYTSHPEYAGQWSGGGNSRLIATPVPVTVGDTSTFDVALEAGTALTGTLRLPRGQVPESGSVAVVDADTYDQIGHVDIALDGRYAVRYAGPVRAAFAVIASVSGESGLGWHREATDFTGARVVRLPSGGTPTLDLRAPAPTS